MLQRMNILKDNNVINEEIYLFSLDVFNNVLLTEGFKSKDLETFMTHLAMASQRILNNDIADSMDDVIFREISSSKEFDFANEILDRILSKSNIDFPQSEIEYLLLHLVNVARKRGGEKEWSRL